VPCYPSVYHTSSNTLDRLQRPYHKGYFLSGHYSVCTNQPFTYIPAGSRKPKLCTPPQPRQPSVYNSAIRFANKIASVVYATKSRASGAALSIFSIRGLKCQLDTLYKGSIPSISLSEFKKSALSTHTPEAYLMAIPIVLGFITPLRNAEVPAANSDALMRNQYPQPFCASSSAAAWHRSGILWRSVASCITSAAALKLYPQLSAFQ
jgi:hypothetical protein